MNRKHLMEIIVILTILLSAIVIAIRFGNWKLQFGAKEAAIQGIQKIQEGALLIDVRTPGEFASGHYPGAINIPIQEFPESLHRIPKGKPIVVYCTAGGRSASARDILIRNGYEDVTNAGGLGDLLRAKEAMK